MKSQEELLLSGGRKRVDVIVLTDNRDHPQSDKRQQSGPIDKAHIDFRSSAFKETEVDPLQFQKNQFNYTQDDELMAELNRRIFDLEKRVHVLESKEGLQPDSSREGQQVKRRKTHESRPSRNYNAIKCPHCSKSYGTDTALKYHIKLKHPVKDEESK